MPRFHTITRIVAAAVAIGAIAAPTAVARPGGPASAQASTAVQRAQRAGDLRHLEAANSIRFVDTVDGKRWQDLRHLEAGNSIQPADTAGGRRVQDLRHLEAGNSIRPVDAVDGKPHAGGQGDGTPWVTIGVVAAMCLALAGAAAVVLTRPRVAT
jgi:hypothetical protein